MGVKVEGSERGSARFTRLISGEAFRSRIGCANVRARTPLLMLIKTPSASIMIQPLLLLSFSLSPFHTHLSLSFFRTTRCRASSRDRASRERSCVGDLDQRSYRRNSEPRRAKLRKLQSSFYGQKLAIRHYAREESHA